MPKIISYLMVFIALILSNCTNVMQGTTQPDLPRSQKEERRLAQGSVFDNFNQSLGNITFGINTKVASKALEETLWQASLQIMQNKPLISVDSHSGIMITDWYQQHDQKIKIHIIITAADNYDEALNVQAFVHNADQDYALAQQIKAEIIALAE